MEIKGTAVKSIPEFVLANYPERYTEWLNALPQASKDIFLNSVISSKWYAISDAAIVPTKMVAQLFFGSNNKKAAWELGRFSADIALHGIYKLYVKFSTPSHVVSRASRILSAYYDPSCIEIIDMQDKKATFHLTDFGKSSDVIEFRIAGWMERALEISGSPECTITIPKSITKGNPYTEFHSAWV